VLLSLFFPHQLTHDLFVIPVVYSAAKTQQAKEAKAKAATAIPMYNKDAKL
jgi:hypothetical protein